MKGLTLTYLFGGS